VRSARAAGAWTARARTLAAWMALVPLLLGAAAAPLDPMNARDATTFPRALGAHPGAGIEWWYVTGILRDDAARPLGFQLTFFRVRVGGDSAFAQPGARAPSAWRGDLYFGHFAVTDPADDRFRYDERISRTAVALAGADSTDLDVWIRDWSLRRLDDGRMRLHASGAPGELDLDLTPPRRRPIAWGPEYVSYKDAARRTFSRYQSYPRLAAEGRYASPGVPSRAVRGEAWFDHEWSDAVTPPGVAGWDWLGLRIADGRSVMIYRMRDRKGGTAHVYAAIARPDGSVDAFRESQVSLTPLRTWTSLRTGARYPVAWRILMTPRGGNPLEIQVFPALADQELDTKRSTQVIYWEGMVEGRAKEDGVQQPVEGYLELTGYAGGPWPAP